MIEKLNILNLLYTIYRMRAFLILSCISSAFAYQASNRRSGDLVRQEESLFDRLLGREAQARIIESVTTWATEKARENPGCVERFVCESYRTGETMNGIPYLLMSLTNAAVSFIVAEQFGDAIEMDAITRAARYGRSTGTCERMECPILDGQLRTVTDYLAGVEEILGYIVNSIQTSIG